MISAPSSFLRPPDILFFLVRSSHVYVVPPLVRVVQCIFFFVRCTKKTWKMLHDSQSLESYPSDCRIHIHIICTCSRQHILHQNTHALVVIIIKTFEWTLHAIERNPRGFFFFRSMRTSIRFSTLLVPVNSAGAGGPALLHSRPDTLDRWTLESAF